MGIVTVGSDVTSFRMIEKITRIGDQHIAGKANWSKALPYVVLEAMAQLAALDVRYRLDFCRHAFLLKVKRCDWPPGEVICGRWSLSARRLNHGSAAYLYHTRANGPENKPVEAQMLIGALDYDERFDHKVLQTHYRKVFACLSKDTGKS
ncbi:MAG: hypothetical protein GY874_11150 [Desulfobacteraceae bacterium]|nr:hypothetical protein [Desulfobacteraceae bacterium]